MPCGDVDGEVTEAFCGAVRAILTFWPLGPVETGLDAATPAPDAEVVAGREAWAGIAAETAGVVRGGAAGVVRGGGAVTIRAVGRPSGTGKAARVAWSAESGGASCSSSRAAAGALAGCRPGALAFRDRRLIRGRAGGAVSRFNSPGSEAESGWAAGGGVSGMTHPQIAPACADSKTYPIISKDFVLNLLHVFA